MSGREGRQTLRVATYNVHSWQGTDGAVDPQRTMDTLAALDADMVALQEVVSPHLAGAGYSLRELAQAYGYHVTFGPTMFRSDSRYGNALLSRQPPDGIGRHNLECVNREPRGALDATFACGDTTLRLLTTHLGLKRWERACQMRALQPLLDGEEAAVTVLMGDLNEWLPWGYARRRMRALFGDAPAPRTFPSGWPLFALDRIHVRPGSRVLSLSAPKTAATRLASDHLPLLADIDLSPSDSPGGFPGSRDEGSHDGGSR
jgi:endonuclease/exonuclease/phosphatase family metal-dependent hydrolase